MKIYQHKLLYFFILIIGIVFLMPTKMNAQNNQQLFEQGNTAYRNGEYQKALEYYESILSAGYESAEVYFNLGNTYYRLNNVGKSVLNYEKAKLLSPNDNSIDINLEKANLLVKQKVEPLPEFFLHVFLTNFRNFFGINTWTNMSIAFFVFMILLAFVFVFSSSVSIRKWMFSLVFVMLMFFSISFWAAYTSKSQLVSHKNAIVMKANAEAYSSPDKIGVLIFTLAEGVKVEISSIRQDWVEIRLADGKIAWLPASSIELI